ncbi:MAG: NusG domain II-containing protein [Clostridiales bacterium]|nr:NusG domain II-containing protein [Clostridiales bacterium]
MADGGKTRRNDILLIAALLVLGGALALFLYVTRQGGGYVSVQIGGETVMELPLGEDTRIVLGQGAHTNTLVIENGTVRVIEASCPDQICVNHGAVQYAGESIVCLPHRLVVTVEGGQVNDVDATAK